VKCPVDVVPRTDRISHTEPMDHKGVVVCAGLKVRRHLKVGEKHLWFKPVVLVLDRNVDAGGARISELTWQSSNEKDKTYTKPKTAMHVPSVR